MSPHTYLQPSLQTGKSTTLNAFLPAIVIEYFTRCSAPGSSTSSSSGSSSSGTGGGRPQVPVPNFLSITCADCQRFQGSGAFLNGLLLQLKSCAAGEGLAAAAAAAATEQKCGKPSTAANFAPFFDSLPRDRLNIILVDEIQNAYLLQQTVGGQLGQRQQDVDAVLHMRR